MRVLTHDDASQVFGANRAIGERAEIKLGPKEARRKMGMQRLMSAAHAAGYAMAAEDFEPEPRPEPVPPVREREARALALRAPTPLTIELLRIRRMYRSLRRLLLSDWIAAHWSGRAPA
jgi:hypothetical protein